MTTLIEGVSVIAGKWSDPNYKELYKPLVAVFADTSVADATPLILSALRKINVKYPIESIFACGTGTGLRTINTFATDPFGKLNWPQAISTATQYVNAMKRPTELVFIIGSTPTPTPHMAECMQGWAAAMADSITRVHVISFAEEPTDFMYFLSRSGSTMGLYKSSPDLKYFNACVDEVIAEMSNPSPRVLCVAGDKSYNAVTFWKGDHLEYRLYGLETILAGVTDVTIDTGLGTITIPHIKSDPDPTVELFLYCILTAVSNTAAYKEISKKIQSNITFHTPLRTYIKQTLVSLGDEPSLEDLSAVLFTVPVVPKGNGYPSIPPPEGFEIIAGETYASIINRGDFIVAGDTTFDRATFDKTPEVFPLPLFLNDEHAAVVLERLSEYSPDILMRQCLTAVSTEFSKQTPMSNTIISSAKWLYKILQPEKLPFPGVFGAADKGRLQSDPVDLLIEYITADQKPTQYMVVAAIEEVTRRVIKEKLNGLSQADIEKLIWNLLDLNDSPIDWSLVSAYEYASPGGIDPRDQFIRALTNDLDSVLASLKTPDEYFIFPEAERCALVYHKLFGAMYMPDVHSHIAMCLQNMMQSNNRLRAKALSKVLSFTPFGERYVIVDADLQAYNDFISPGSDQRAKLYLRALFSYLAKRYSWKVPTGDKELFVSSPNLKIAADVLKGLSVSEVPIYLDLFLKPVISACEKFNMVVTGMYNGTSLFVDGADLAASPYKVKNKTMRQYAEANPELR